MGFIKRRTEPEQPPVAIIAGLGNPGAQYSGTRHNVGFEVVEALAKKHGIVLKTHRHQAQFGVGTISGKSVLLVKPLTYMNLSGRSVGAIARHYRIKVEAILVAADDLDMDTARVRLKPKGSSGGHNGHKSIIQALGSDEYPRLKIGIGKGQEGREHVLSRFKPDERAQINEAVGKCVEGCEIWLSDGIELAMNRVNGS